MLIHIEGLEDLEEDKEGHCLVKVKKDLKD
jgi:hypothetical protein